MEPFEWLILGIGFAVGTMLGAGSKPLVKTAAKGYLTVEEKARQARDRARRVSEEAREEFRDAIAEARYERDGAETLPEPATRRTRGRAKAEQATTSQEKSTSGGRSKRKPMSEETRRKISEAMRQRRTAQQTSNQ